MATVDSSKNVRIVPSGQVYRQMFDAQLQLNRSLSRYDTESRLQRLKSRELTHSQSLPLIRLDHEETQHGILTSRQKTWIGGFPNDPYVENPVLYKQYSEYMTQKLQDTETSQAGREVRGLPDVVVSKKQGSDIVERIAESRRQRHESAVEDMHQELSVISAEMEPLIEELSENLLNKLAEDDKDIATILRRIDDDEMLLTYDLKGIMSLWEEVEAHSPKRQAWILEMDTELRKLEANRMSKIRDVFNRYGEKMHKIAHLMKPNLQRSLDKDSQMINQTMLSNQRSYADLYVRLVSADVEREKAQRTVWRRRLEEWKKLNTKLAVESFKEFMTTPAVVSPPGVENVRMSLITDQEVLNRQRLELVETLCDMKPPNATKSAVYRWRQDMKSLTSELDNITQMHLSKLHEEYEKVCQMCLEKIESIRAALVESGICSAHRVAQVMDEFMLPLVGEQQRLFEQELEVMEKSIEDHCAYLDEEMAALFKFSQGAAHVWDTHEIGLARQERALQEKLETARRAHDQANQEKEAHLDIVMDRMRQDASELALKDSLVKALTMLDKIRETYEEFHEQQVEIVKSYPDMVQEELSNYEDGVCSYFSVGRWPVRPTEMEDPPFDPSEDFNEIITTTNGNEFYVVKPKQPEENQESEELGAGSGSGSGSQQQVQGEREGGGEEEDAEEKQDAFLTEVYGQKESEESPEGEEETAEYITSIDIPQDVIVRVKKTIRLNFLEHLDSWCEQAVERSDSVVVAKCEELNSELDLRLHLHQPRPRRAELDVHNVRAAELVLHTERVARHCAGMEHSLAELGTKFKAMSHEHNKLANKFRADIEALEVVFVNATKSARLVKLQNQVTIELDKFMSVIRASLRQFRQHLDQTLQMLRESNARFIKSFKVFSEGGNFCPEEIEEHRKKLEKMSAMIDSSEGSIMSDLEGMESRRLDVATKIAVEFEDRFKGHMSDLVFMERVARWLTNTQVKIKAEVASSNAQAQRIVNMLDTLERRVDACARPNLDKEQITASQLNQSLFSIFEAFVARSEYLNCLKPGGSQTNVPGGVATAKVGFSAESPQHNTGKAGKGAEDPSVNVIKSILNSPPAPKERTQRSKLRFGLDADLDGESGGGMDSSREKTKSAMSQASSKGSEASKSTRKAVPVTADTAPRRSQSGHRRTSKMSKFDRKSLVLDKEDGLDGERAEVESFMSSIQKTLREARDGLITTSEVFYRQKGTRPVTRPQALQETHEQCSDIIAAKLQSYAQQADQYHNQCLQELRAQLVRFEQLSAHVPALVISDLLRDEVQRLHKVQSEMTTRFQATLDQLAGRQQSNMNELRPKLGHPTHSDQLSRLCEQEQERHGDYVEAVSKHTVQRQECALQESGTFLERMINTAELQLLQYDGMLVVDDVEKGRVEPTLYPTCELIRRMNAGEPLEDDEDKGALPRGKASWIGIPSNQFVVEGRPSRLQVTPTVNTRKTTLAHSAVVKARDKAYEDYKEQFEHTLRQIEEEKDRLMLSEQRWEQAWEASVDKVRKLYHTE